jgi:tRNA-uridine 2-sulfurtransferase
MKTLILQKKMDTSRKVLMAMSGGLDSSIAAILLQNQGYEIVGATFRTWDYISESCLAKNTGCCSIDSIQEASGFAEERGFPHFVLDLRNQFKKLVIEDFVSEYASGHTPNPCVVCNAKIKWGIMLEKAEELGCGYIATGHYAGIREYNGNFLLTNAADTDKDQTYFLWQLTSAQLKRTLFPLSGYNKDKVRQLATEYGFTRLSSKRESQEICFVPDNNYRNFIATEYPEIETFSVPGEIFDTKGKFIGMHKGFMNYTIGQRKGLGVAVGEPAYVVSIDPACNRIVIGSKEDLLTETIQVRDFNINKYSEIPGLFEAEVKIRYNTHRVASVVEHNNSKLIVRFRDSVSAATPGQSAVFYQGDECIGGGIIC